MPDTIRTSWRWLRRRRRKIGQSAGTIGAIAVSSAGAAEQPAMIPHELVPHELGLHELVLNAHRGIASMKSLF
jgi:hypothetical protein